MLIGRVPGWKKEEVVIFCWDHDALGDEVFCLDQNNKSLSNRLIKFSGA